MINGNFVLHLHRLRVLTVAQSHHGPITAVESTYLMRSTVQTAASLPGHVTKKTSRWTLSWAISLLCISGDLESETRCLINQLILVHWCQSLHLRCIGSNYQTVDAMILSWMMSSGRRWKTLFEKVEVAHQSLLILSLTMTRCTLMQAGYAKLASICRWRENSEVAIPE